MCFNRSSPCTVNGTPVPLLGTPVLAVTELSFLIKRSPIFHLKKIPWLLCYLHTHHCALAKVCGCIVEISDSHRITEQFGLGGTLRITQFPPPAMGRDPSLCIFSEDKEKIFNILTEIQFYGNFYDNRYFERFLKKKKKPFSSSQNQIHFLKITINY